MIRLMQLTLTIALATGALLNSSATHAQPEVSLTKITDFSTRIGGGAFSTCPTQLAWTNDGEILAADSCKSGVIKCQKDGDCETFALGAPSSSIRGVAVDLQDNVYYTRTQQNLVYRCEPGEACQELFGERGTAPGQFNEPKEIVIDSQGRLVIADRHNSRIQFCDVQGNCTVHGQKYDNQGPVAPGEFGEPFALFADRKGEILVGDFGPETVHVCNESGACSKVLGGEGNGVNEFKTPAGLGVTSRGDIVVVELSNKRISVCDRQGECAAFGEPDFDLRAPTGLLIDENDRLYVGEQDGRRISVFDLAYLDEPPPGPDPFLINAGLNDAWLNDDTVGQGFFIIVFPDTGIVFLAWFTYDTERPPEDVLALLGEPGHRWVTAQGPFDGDTANLTVYLTEGGVFDMAEPAAVTDTENPIGTITIVWHDCENATLTYDIDPPGVMGEIPIRRIVPDNVALCEALVGAQ